VRNRGLSSIFFLLLLFFAVCFALSQKAATNYDTLLRQYATAQDYYDKATNLSFAKEYGPREEALEKEWNRRALTGFTTLYRQIPKISLYDSLLFYTAFRIGELQHYFENFSEAIAGYKEAIRSKEKSSLPDSVLFKPLLYAGIIFYNQNKFDTAVQFFKQAEKIDAAYANKLSEGERLYNITGVLYYEQGNYKQAGNYFQKALQVLSKSNPYYNELFVNYNINLAQLYLRLEEYKKANDIYQKLIPLKANLNEIYHNIGSLNLSQGEAAEAIYYLRKVHFQNNKITRLYNSMGNAFFKLNEFDSASFYFQKAVDAYRSLGANSDPIGYGSVLKSLGDYHYHFHHYNEALRYYQKAVHQFYPAYGHESVANNPEQFSGVFSYINLFGVLNAKAEVWHTLYLQNKDSNAAQQELAVYQSAFKLIDYVERTYESDEARLFLTKTIHAVHDKPINVAFELYQQTGNKKYLSLLYSFDQQNKATVLALNRQLNTALAENTSSAVQKERRIKQEITRLSIRSAQATDSAQLATFNNSIRDYEIELGKLQENLSAKEAVQGSKILSLSSLQSLLDGKTVLVSYHLSPEQLTTLVVTKNRADCYQQALPAGFNNLLQNELLSLKMPSAKPTTAQNPVLYDLLLSHVPLAETEQLIIVPDDVLTYLPFESLQAKEGKFLVQRTAVQYQFSTALLQKNTTDFSAAKTLSFAPFAHRSSTSFSTLPASEQEIKGTEGKQFFDTAATKEKFLEYSKAFPVVHLATHAVANNSADNLSYVVFSPTQTGDNLLYAQEIYNLRLQNTGLVILSACETGAGILAKGEGVLSLSRAFAYAGCPNIITSLWKADDFSTAYLTTRIHQYLDKGLSIAKAVQAAKIDYLADKTINPRLKQPYYWSHLVFVGAYSPEKSFAWMWYLLAGILLLSAFLFYKTKSRKAGP